MLAVQICGNGLCCEARLKLFTNKYHMEVKFKNKVLTEQERKGLISEMDKLIAEYSESIHRYHNRTCANENWKSLLKVLDEIGEYSLRVITDCVVLQKYFLLATSHYEKALFRGKLQVILNEGFKQVYGFKESKKKPSLWNRLSDFAERFPDPLKKRHQDLQEKLEMYSQDSWWMDERNSETHLDIAALYESRETSIVEAKVIMESKELIDILLDVHEFMTNLYGLYCADLYQQYWK